MKKKLLHTRRKVSIDAQNVDTNRIVGLYVLALNRCTDYLLHPRELAGLVTGLKKVYNEGHSFSGCPYEILPLNCLSVGGIDKILISKLNEFTRYNPIFISQKEVDIQNCICKVFSCEVIEYWLSSKKYDSCYQPFYPTWLISSLIISISAKLLGFDEIIDIGSGDARVPYCGAMVGLRGISVELDTNLVELQRQIISSTGVEFEILNIDACMADFDGMNLSKPLFLISGLPEHGEVLAEAVMGNLIRHKSSSSNLGFALMGSHTMKQYSRDLSLYGWGHFIAEHKLSILDCLTLPTMWTNDQSIDTPFIFLMME
jgi:hypothetical protein